MVVPQTITRQHLERELRRLSSAKKAESSAWFFKTGKGQYGYGDKFLGVTVPQQRVVAKKFRTLSLIDLDVLLKSSYHEHRLTAAIILSLQFHKADAMQQNVLATFFLSHAKCFNNWDIVDTVSPTFGGYLLDRPRTVLYGLVSSKNLWERRIAIITNFMFIRHGQYGDTLKIATLLLHDSHDLIHKATGWMLREVGIATVPC